MSTAHSALPPFEYIRPADLDAASRFLTQHPGDARILAGGTDALTRLRTGGWGARYLVDVKHLPGMRAVSYDAAGLRIGAAVTLNALIAAPDVRARVPVLAEAAATVAAYPLRNRATLIGNLCNASPGGDLLGPCLALEAEAEIYGPAGERRASLATFWRGPGATNLQPGEIVTALRIAPPPAGHHAHYRKLGRNILGDLAIVGVTALGYPDATSPSGARFRVALTAVAPTPLRAIEAEALLASGPLGAAVLEQAAAAAEAACRPIDDLRGSARYRRLMVRRLTLQAVLQVWDELKADADNAEDARPR